MTLHRVESLNDEPTFIRALADIAASHLSAFTPDQTQWPGGPQGTEPWNQGRTSRQMQLRCPGCTNPVCSEQKAFFARGTLNVGEDAFAQAVKSNAS